VNHWWRAYNEAVNDPKLQLLSDALFRAWFNVMCIASANGGDLPALKDVAFTLRIAPAKAAQLLAQLHVAGLLDKTETGFVPHNWNGRQYKSDVSTDRVKRFRERKRNVSSAVSETPPETETEQIDVADDARVRPNPSFDLAERLLVIAGHDKSFWPPGWCGAPHRIATWLAQGWKPEIIVAAVTAAAARKRGPPANSVQFFENAIAEEHARQAAPLPQVEIREAQTITVTRHGKPKSAVIQAIDDLNQQFADFDDRGGSDELRGPAGQASPRLLSHG
jgi:hypothetical protein